MVFLFSFVRMYPSFSLFALIYSSCASTAPLLFLVYCTHLNLLRFSGGVLLSFLTTRTPSTVVPIPMRRSRWVWVPRAVPRSSDRSRVGGALGQSVPQVAAESSVEGHRMRIIESMRPGHP